MDTDQSANTIQISKEFSVDTAKLFQAWTEPEQLKQWWHPMGNSLKDVKNDLKKGGEVTYEFEEAGLVISGNYKEVSPNEKLVYTWNWDLTDNKEDASYTLNITFESKENGSVLHILQEGFSGPEAIKPHQEGWDKGLESLKQYLESNGNAGANNTDASSNDNLRSGDQMNDRSGGYNEAPEQVKVGGAE